MGSASMVRCSTTVPRLPDVLVCTIGEAPTTVTVSAMSPASRRAFTVVGWPISTLLPAAVKVLNPTNSTLTV